MSACTTSLRSLHLWPPPPPPPLLHYNFLPHSLPLIASASHVPPICSREAYTLPTASFCKILISWLCNVHFYLPFWVDLDSPLLVIFSSLSSSHICVSIWAFIRSLLRTLFGFLVYPSFWKSMCTNSCLKDSLSSLPLESNFHFLLSSVSSKSRHVFVINLWTLINPWCKVCYFFCSVIIWSFC